MISEEVLLTEEQMFETWTQVSHRLYSQNLNLISKKRVDVGKQEQARTDAFFLFSLLIY